MTVRLSNISLAGMARTLVAVGTSSEAFMFLTTAAAAPRSTATSSPSAVGAAGGLALSGSALAGSGAGLAGAAAAGAAAFGAGGAAAGAGVGVDGADGCPLPFEAVASVVGSGE